MPNTNYRRGVSYEYQIIRDLICSGYAIAQRSAGSKSMFDIWAIPNTPDKPVLFIQCKRSKIGISNIEGYFKEDIERVRQLPFLTNIEYHIYIKIDGEGEEKYRIEKDKLFRFNPITP